MDPGTWIFLLWSLSEWVFSEVLEGLSVGLEYKYEPKSSVWDQKSSDQKSFTWIHLRKVGFPNMAISLPIFAGAFALSILYYLYTWTTRHIYRNSLKKRHGCLPPTRLPQKDPILGTDVVLANLSAAKNHGFLELIRTQHAKYGRTFTTNTFFRTTINTCDPRVLQAVLSLQFEDFGMGPLRSKAASPLLGNGIFTTDNEHWSHQRALIRPSFVRSQVTDFSIFETHVDQLIQLIARENYVVDLQHLMFRMVSHLPSYII